MPRDKDRQDLWGSAQGSVGTDATVCWGSTCSTQTSNACGFTMAGLISDDLGLPRCYPCLEKQEVWFVCVMSSWSLTETSSVLTLLGHLRTSDDQECLGFVPMPRVSSVYVGALFVAVSTKGSSPFVPVSNRNDAYVTIRDLCLRFDRLKKVSLQSHLHSGCLLLPCWSFAIFSHLVSILTHCCSFACPIPTSDFWGSFTERRKLQFQQ